MLTRFRAGVLVGASVVMALVAPVSPALAAGCTTYIDAFHVQHVVCDNQDTQLGTTTQPQDSSGDTGSSNGDSGDNGSSNGDSGSGASTGPHGFATYDEVMCVTAPSARTTADVAAVQGTRNATSVQMYCESDENGGPGFYFWSTPAAAPPPPPPVDLVALSRQARADIAIPTFALQFGPDAKRLAVNMQTTFTAVPDRSMNLGASASDRGVTVTVAGRLVGMAWSPGEPVRCAAGDRKAACSGGRVGPVDCDGTACQYTYHWMSSPARTGGAPVWTVTATATWQFVYTTAGAGPTTGAATGTWTEPMPAGTAAVSMGEWSTAGGYEG